MKKIKTVIIGCGKIGFFNDFKKNLGGNFTHFKSIRYNKNFEIVGVVDKNQKTLKIISELYGIRTSKSYLKLLKNVKVDLIVVSTNDDTHYNILNNITKFKPKFVFTEKPITKRPYQTSKIVKKYQKENIKLSVNYSRRFSKSYIKVRKHIKEKKIGKIHAVELNYSRGFYHNAVHLIDLSLWYFGNPKKIVTEKKKPSLSYKGDITAVIRLEYSNFDVRIKGLDINFLGNQEIDIIGDKGRIIINPDNQIRFFKINNHKHYDKMKFFSLQKVEKIDEPNILNNTYKTIHSEIYNQKKLVTSDALNSIEISKILLAI